MISHVNGLAADLGCAPGQGCAEAAKLLRAADAPGAAPPALEETVRLVSAEPGALQVWAFDSASLIGPAGIVIHSLL